jgi:hypothetical protein
VSGSDLDTGKGKDPFCPGGKRSRSVHFDVFGFDAVAPDIFCFWLCSMKILSSLAKQAYSIRPANRQQPKTSDEFLFRMIKHSGQKLDLL